MRMPQRLTAGCLCLLLCLSVGFSVAEDTTLTPEPAATIDPNMETEGFVSDEEPETVELDAQGQTASIAGLTPLYTTQIKPFTANGTAIRMRAEQSGDSAVVCSINRGEIITIYAVYPSYVLAEYNGYVGYVIRTWIDEAVTTIDPSTTPPYGTTLSQYVATTTAPANVYMYPSTDAPINDIVIGEGSKIAVLEFVDGFAKILYWRSYGYVDAALLTDLVVVSQTDEPLSPDTPIAAFASYFAYNTGVEGNEGRCKNIVRSCELMTRVMQPGESLDFNSQIGPYKRTNGYFPAPVLIGGGSQLGYGGGTCQSSSTLYNTIRQLSGVTVLKRRPHGPGCAKYLPMHQDAAVGNASLNLIIRNDYDFPIRIEAFSKGEGSICIQVFRGE
ncbi:MAG: VanW family protein [Eubacteriales bacterium]|nr:VanW family protein [Eubacteriales bacterium]